MPSEDLDPHAILHTLGLLDVTAIAPVHGGSDTALWRVEHADQVYALRVFPIGRHESCERERQVMQDASNAGLPVPRVHMAGSWHEHAALLLSWLPGWTVADEIFHHPWRAWQVGVLFGCMQGDIHKLPAPGILCQDRYEWTSWWGPLEPSLQKRLQALNGQANRLLHLDYHPLNVLTDGHRITGVLDWQNARAGEPYADAARTLSILRVDAVRRLSFLERAILRVFELGWRHGYEQQGASLKEMSLFYAWAGAVMERDLAQKRGPEDMALIHAWTVKWKKRAGVAD